MADKTTRLKIVVDDSDLIKSIRRVKGEAVKPVKGSYGKSRRKTTAFPRGTGPRGPGYQPDILEASPEEMVAGRRKRKLVPKTRTRISHDIVRRDRMEGDIYARTQKIKGLQREGAGDKRLLEKIDKEIMARQRSINSLKEKSGVMKADIAGTKESIAARKENIAHLKREVREKKGTGRRYRDISGAQVSRPSQKQMETQFGQDQKSIGVMAQAKAKADVQLEKENALLKENMARRKGVAAAVKQNAAAQRELQQESEREVASLQKQGFMMQRLNIAVLGMNMSLLGLSFNLERSGLLSEEQSESMVKMISSVQIVLSIVNFASAAMYLQNEVKKMSILSNMKLSVSNSVLAGTFARLKWSIIGSSMAFASLFMLAYAFTQESPKIRGALMAIAGAMVGVFIASQLVTAGHLAEWTARFGPAAPLIIPGIMAGILGAMGWVSATFQAQKSKTKMNTGGIILRDESVIAGESRAEVISPLGSAQAQAVADDLGRRARGSGMRGLITHSTINIFGGFGDDPGDTVRELDALVG